MEVIPSCDFNRDNRRAFKFRKKTDEFYLVGAISVKKQNWHSLCDWVVGEFFPVEPQIRQDGETFRHRPAQTASASSVSVRW
jgi:hypothetical protein